MATEKTRLLEEAVPTFGSTVTTNGKPDDFSYTSIGRWNTASSTNQEKLWKKEQDDYHHLENGKTNSKGTRKLKLVKEWPFRNYLFGLIGISVSVFVLLQLFHFLRQTPDLYDSEREFPNGSKIQFFAPEVQLFLRVNTSSKDALTPFVFTKTDGNLIADITFPWLHGSTFEIFRLNSRCFQLKSMKNLWLTIDNENGNLVAAGVTRLDGSYFAIEPVSDRNDTKPTYQLKECNYKSYFALYESQSREYSVRLIPRSLSRRQREWFQWFSNDRNSSTLSEGKILKAAFEIHRLQPLFGVNLGGWFIPEYWMNPTFFNQSGLGWASSLCTFKSKAPILVEEKMSAHLAEWIQEDDFHQIYSLGFNSIRLPVGYWNLIEDPYNRSVPSNLSVSLHYLDWVFDIAEKLNITVLVDLHGAPGSQNGADHSGCLNIRQFAQPQNVRLALKAIDVIMRRYSQRDNFLGVELLNEPSKELTVQNHALLLSYYERAYDIIRKYHKSCYIVINELVERNFGSWKGALQEPAYYNVIMDYHLYNWQHPYTYETADQHLRHARDWKGMIEGFSIQHPIVVGEWSMSTGVAMQVGQTFVDVSVDSFTKAFGWYLWSWKIERNPIYDTWDVQYQMITLKEKNQGLDPFHYYEEHQP